MAAAKSDTFRSDNALGVLEFKHHRINHSMRFAKDRNHINGIENIRNQAKRLRKFNGVPREHFYLSFKECEWRWSMEQTTDDLSSSLVKTNGSKCPNI